MGTVTAVDLPGRRVTVDETDVVDYDTLVVAAGAVSDDFGVAGIAEHALTLKSVDDATTMRDQVLRQFERATVEPDAVRDGAMNVVVCGGGPTGVELAGGLAELYRKVLARDAPGVDLSPARIVLVEAADRLLAPFTPESSLGALEALERHGVEVRLGTGVAAANADGVVLSDGTAIAAPTVVWAAGVRAHPLAALLGVELDRRGRIVVDGDLSVPGHPEVFAIGDIAAAAWGDGVCPQVAQPAIQGGRHVGTQIGHRLRGEPTERFVYVDKGSMATIGRNAAVTELPNGWRFGGFVGWVAWLGLHLVTLVGVRNRLRVLVNWGWNYITYDRGSRLLAESVRRRPTG